MNPPQNSMYYQQNYNNKFDAQNYAVIVEPNNFNNGNVNGNFEGMYIPKKIGNQNYPEPSNVYDPFDGKKM